MSLLKYLGQVRDSSYAKHSGIYCIFIIVAIRRSEGNLYWSLKNANCDGILLTWSGQTSQWRFLRDFVIQPTKCAFNPACGGVGNNSPVLYQYALNVNKIKSSISFLWEFLKFSLEILCQFLLLKITHTALYVHFL